MHTLCSAAGSNFLIKYDNQYDAPNQFQQIVDKRIECNYVAIGLRTFHSPNQTLAQSTRQGSLRLWRSTNFNFSCIAAPYISLHSAYAKRRLRIHFFS